MYCARRSPSCLVSVVLAVTFGIRAPAAPVSRETKACLECHEEATPGIVADWRRSRHARLTVAEALGKDTLERRISAKKVPARYKSFAVGCAECHTLSPESHKDTFDHNSYRVHVVVSPADCSLCHPVEKEQFEKNLMAHAYKNLMGNPVFKSLAFAANSPESLSGGVVSQGEAPAHTEAESCLACHGTRVEVKGLRERETIMGEMDFPVLSGWPNQGVGRINPDGSLGSCSACHARHGFSIAAARKPYTCSQCHKGPDVPAYKVYMVSKHGNLFSTHQSEWNFDSVPWRVGYDFTAPTCATCHVSLLTDAAGNVIAERTHRMNDRSRWRLFGLPYAHPHPKDPDTTKIRNKAGLPLPAELTGEPVAEALIDLKEQEEREAAMQQVCMACHSESWVTGKFERIAKTVEATNKRTQVATKLLLETYRRGLAKGPAQGDSLFNEAIERMWVECWLFYANSIRFSAAMAGADYGAFANGRWYLGHAIRAMEDYLRFLRAAKK